MKKILVRMGLVLAITAGASGMASAANGAHDVLQPDTKQYCC
ncbi:MAG: hypothetical protein JWR52_2504 [Marmoricola sp.]|nr:hypothetical protein [Marmoricola sp.]